MNTPNSGNQTGSRLHPSQESGKNGIETVVLVVISSFAVGLIPMACGFAVQPKGEIAPILGEASLWKDMDLRE